MIVAIIALVMATTGTAVAASKLVSGDSLVKKGTLSGNRLRKHTLTGTQINLRKLGRVPSATNANHATSATNATNATNATTAANLTGVTRFRTTIQPAGTSYSTAAVVTLGTAGPLSLVGECYSSAGAITGDVFLSTTANAEYSAYLDSSGNVTGPLAPGTDQPVGYIPATSTPPTVDFEGSSDGTFAALTNNLSNYLTGLASVATNMNSSGGCTFAGFTSAS